MIGSAGETAEEGTAEVLGLRYLRHSILVGVAAAAAFPAASSAGLLPPQTLDAGTGKDALQVGTSIGSHKAWAGFIQQTGGHDRLYAAYARNGAFHAPFAVDNGNAIEGGELAGSENGTAVAVWTEKVNGKGVVFGRRLTGGKAGPAVQISAPGEDAGAGGNGMFEFDRAWGLAMNAKGAAALCYGDATAMKSHVAVLAAGQNQWQSYTLDTGCSDPGIDGRGNVAVFDGKFASRVVNGQVIKDDLAANYMDEGSLAVGPGGTALAVGRDNNFHVFAYRMVDIASNTPWQMVGGNLEEGLIATPGLSPEDPFAALDAHGNGAVTFRDNSAANPHGYYRLVTAGTPGDGGTLYASGSRGRIAVDGNGNPIVAYSAADFKSSLVRRFTGGAFAPELPLAPSLTDYTVPSSVGIDANSAGDFIVLVAQGLNPTTLHAVFGDFNPPILRPKAKPKKPKVDQKVKLKSRATDSFASLNGSAVSWSLPAGVQRARTQTGKTIKVRFTNPGRYKIVVTATDPGGNQTQKKLKLHVKR